MIAVQTPMPTKVALLATLAITATAVVVFLLARAHADEPGFAAPFLWLFAVLFLARVVGQVLVRAQRPAWLPPTEDWNLTPYQLLLPTQVAILAVMGWIAIDFSSRSGFWVDARPSLGIAVIAFSFAYASAMGIRYAVRMRRRPEERWFGGTIPIVFHEVLASFLFILGSFHAAH